MDSIELLPARDEFPRAAFDRFCRDEGEPRTFVPLGRVGGAVQIAGFEQPDHWIVTTAGLSRMPLVSGEPTEFWTRVEPEAAMAGEIALRAAVETIVAQGLRMWGPGHVWMNDQPLLKDTRIQALAVNPADRPEDVVRAADGTVLGRMRELWLLTKAEARSLALDGSGALDAVVASDPAALQWMERDDAVVSESIPDVPCMVTDMLDDHPARWVETDSEGRFLAFSQLEPPGYFNDNSHFKLWSLPLLVERNPGIADFVRTADPLEFLVYDDGRWVRGRLDQLS